MPQIKTTSDHYIAKDRFNALEYRINQKNYNYIMDVIRFYHDSIYMLPDDEIIHAEKIDGKNKSTNCSVPINHLVFI